MRLQGIAPIGSIEASGVKWHCWLALPPKFMTQICCEERTLPDPYWLRVALLRELAWVKLESVQVAACKIPSVDQASLVL